MPIILFLLILIKINILILFALVIQRGMILEWMHLTGMIFLLCIQRGMVFAADA